MLIQGLACVCVCMYVCVCVCPEWALKPVGGHKPPEHYPLGQNPISGKAGRNPQDITSCRIRTQCTMLFYVTGKGVLQAKFQDWRT